MRQCRVTGGRRRQSESAANSAASATKTTRAQFRKIKHALDVRAYRTRLRELDAANNTQGDAASRRVTPQGDATSRCVTPATFHENFPTNSSEFGIISNVTRGTYNTVFSLALAIVGAMAASLRSDASPDILRGGGGSPFSARPCSRLLVA